MFWMLCCKTHNLIKKTFGLKIEKLKEFGKPFLGWTIRVEIFLVQGWYFYIIFYLLTEYLLYLSNIFFLFYIQKKYEKVIDNIFHVNLKKKRYVCNKSSICSSLTLTRWRWIQFIIRQNFVLVDWNEKNCKIRKFCILIKQEINI